MASRPFLGIDYGTTSSVMAWWDGSDAKVIKNSQLETKTPSLVYYDHANEHIEIGINVAVRIESLAAETDPVRRLESCLPVIAGAKRHLGTDRLYAVDFDPDHAVSSRAVASIILQKLKDDAEDAHFPEAVTRAVIACPAGFDDKQRSALIEAARDAEFTDVALIAEPEAAALAFAKDGRGVGSCVLVCDLGGAASNMSIVRRTGEWQFEVVLHDSDEECGGDHFDRAVYGYLDLQVRRQTGEGIRPIESTELAFLFEEDKPILFECRRWKERLSRSALPRPFVATLSGGRTATLEIDRPTFDELIRLRVEKTVAKTAALIDRARQAGHAIDTVLVIGGSSRVPLLRERLMDVLPVTPLAWQNQDVAVALGCAHYGSQIRWEESGWRTASGPGPVLTPLPVAPPVPPAVIADADTVAVAQTSQEAGWRGLGLSVLAGVVLIGAVLGAVALLGNNRSQPSQIRRTQPSYIGQPSTTAPEAQASAPPAAAPEPAPTPEPNTPLQAPNWETPLMGRWAGGYDCADGHAGMDVNFERIDGHDHLIAHIHVFRQRAPGVNSLEVRDVEAHFQVESRGGNEIWAFFDEPVKGGSPDDEWPELMANLTSATTIEGQLDDGCRVTLSKAQ